MRYFFTLFLFACAPEIGYAPQEQEFSDFGGWGEGIPGFEITASPTTDSGSGGGALDLNGVYLGSYTVTIVREGLGDTCMGTGSLTMAVEDSEIRVGQGSQISLDCGIYTSMRFRGIFDETGVITGEVFEESVLNIQSIWTGVYLDNTITGTFTDYLTSDQGMIALDGSITVSK